MNGFFWAKALGCLLLPAALLFGCKPQIGDDCENSTNCSAIGDRLCDTTQPGGYCTMFNCEPGSCPDEAICIGYGNVPSSVSGCSDKQGGQRFQRTFCLRRCDSNSDCRSHYQCIDMGRENRWGAVVIEGGRRNGKVCAVPFEGEPLDRDKQNGVCTGSWSGAEAGAPRDAALADSADGAANSTDASADAPVSDAPDESSSAGDANLDAGGD